MQRSSKASPGVSYSQRESNDYCAQPPNDKMELTCRKILHLLMKPAIKNEQLTFERCQLRCHFPAIKKAVLLPIYS